jgi:hypothetical protein
MFTKQHYAAVAAIIHTAQVNDDEQMDGEGTDSIQRIATGLADLFAGDNPRFRRVQFLAACRGKKMTPRAAKAAQAAHEVTA